MMRNTLEYLNTHLPDVDWLIILLGIWAPNDEIFNINFKYIKQRDVIEAEFPNEDGFWDMMMAPLSEKEIRKQNRIRIPKELRYEV